jgi:hypothetical protein
LAVRGARVDTAERVELSSADIHDHNTSEDPDRVKLGAPSLIEGVNGALRVVLPAASVTRFLADLR